MLSGKEMPKVQLDGRSALNRQTMIMENGRTWGQATSNVRSVAARSDDLNI